MMAVGHTKSSGILLLATAMLGALAAVMLGVSPAQSHTTTATLFPNGQGTHVAWDNDEGDIDETGTPVCNANDYVESTATGQRESVLIDLAGVPNGSTITSVSVEAFHRGIGGSGGGNGGTFQTFARLDGTITDSGTNIATIQSGGGSACNAAAPQSITVTATVKSASTVLEVGVLKTATNTTNVRVGALRATVTYNRPPAVPTLATPSDGSTTADRTPTFDWSDGSDPDGSDSSFTYDIQRAPYTAGNCVWGSATTNTVSSSTFTPATEMSFGTHCWRVRTIDHGGLTSAFTTHRTLTIQQPSVSAVITADDKEYDGTTDATYSCDVVGEDSGDEVACSGTSATFDTKDVGTGKTVTVNGITLGGADAGSYTLSNTSDTDVANITKKTLSVDAANASKEYGDADPVFLYSLSGFVSGENAGNAAGLGGSASCTRDPGESVSGSPYAISCDPDTLTATNYDFEPGDEGDLTIDPATLSVDADDQTKTYGDADPAFTATLSGFKNGEDETGAGVTGDPDCTRAPGQSVAGSPYPITCGPGTLAAANYEFETGDTGTLTVETAEVSAEITAEDKEYDGTTDAAYTCEVSGAQGGDDVDCDGTHPATFDDADVGTNKTVTATGLALSGDDAGNYTLSGSTDTDEADITEATLAVDADDATKDYGDDDPTFTYSLSGFVDGEDESTAAGLGGSADCTRAPGETVAGSPYPITCAPGSLVADNYDFETGDEGQLTIEKADPNCTVDGFTGTYDGDAHGASGSCDGVDDEGPLPGLDLGASYTDVPGGTASWTFTDETGNYDDDSGTATIQIDAAVLSVDADDQSKDFGEPDPALTYSLSGFVAGEDDASAGVSGSADCTRAPGEAVAGSPYAITCEPGSLSATNYTFQTGDTGELTIGAGEVSAEITASDKQYDGTTDAEYTCAVVGAESGDDVSCDGDDPAAFDTANAGTGKTVTATNLFLTGDDAGNYALGNTEDTDEADITQATLSVDADDKTKAYGDDDPILTYSLSGFVSGEDEMNVPITGAGECTRAPGETVGGSPYEITCTPGDLSADNYQFEAGEPGELTIDAATLSVDADDKSKAYGEDDPTFTYSLSGFADGEDATSAGVTGEADCTRDAGEDVGTYTITCDPGTLAAADYSFETGDTGTLTIEGAEVSAEITASDKQYDGLVDAEYTCEVQGVQGDDDVTCDGDHPATFDDANVGSNKTVTAINLVLSGADSGNYTLSNGSDTDEADITQATLSVDADDKTKEFGEDDPTLTYTLTGFIAPDDESTVPITGAGECTRAPGETVAGSPYEITCTPGDLEADNYSFQTGDPGQLTITPDTSVPSVTINQAEAQDDPTSESPIAFDVVFSEDVTGFGDDDVELSGSAGATTAEVTGDGPEYTVSVSGMASSGTVVATVKAGAATDGSNDSTASTSDDNTVTYDKPIVEFDPGPTATISGVPRVGGTLTAGEGSPSPEPDSYEYEWFANGDAIAGQTGKTFSPTNAHVGQAITVEVTAVKAGFTSASDLSDPTGPVGTLPAKTIQVTTNGGAAFAGDRIAISVLRLQPHEAYTVTFDGEVIKTGTANLLGNANFNHVIPLTQQPGTYTVGVVGSLPDRTGTDTFVVKAPSSLGVTLSKTSVPAGGTQRVTVTNLLNGEKVEVRDNGTLVSPSSAVGNSMGGYAVSYPVGTTTGSHTVEVTGTYNGRTTTKTYTVTGP